MIGIGVAALSALAAGAANTLGVGTLGNLIIGGLATKSVIDGVKKIRDVTGRISDEYDENRSVGYNIPDSLSNSLRETKQYYRDEIIGVEHQKLIPAVIFLTPDEVQRRLK